jgi:penicillin-binding protein 1A
MRFLVRFLGFLFAAGTVVFLVAVGAVAGAIWHFSKDLPDYSQLQDYEPPVMTRVHAADGSLLGEYAKERRLYLPIQAVPKLVINAFLAAEDKNFYEHGGIDYSGMARAALLYAQNYGSNRRPQGASTITQQVAKNFLLTNEVSIARKAKEAILAFRIEQTLSKDRILELYLNEIYLGLGSYGVAAAALNYFNKSLDELTVAEAAYLAALPKAPNNYHPIRQADAAKARRNWVLGRMAEDGAITWDEMRAAAAEPLVVHMPDPTRIVPADYFVEDVRRQLVERYGEEALYEGGMSVRTTLEPRLQEIAESELRRGLVAYDHRHGWRGAIARIDVAGDWRAALLRVPRQPLHPDWTLAVVLGLDGAAAKIGFADGAEGTIPLAALTWARRAVGEDALGAKIQAPSDVLSKGDVVAVARLREGQEGYAPGAFALEQVPEINGAVVAMDPHTGRVLAMVGGWSYAESQFNRASQAMRQPGSAFKPIVYAAALDHGFTPSSLVLDAPFAIDQGPGLGVWKPQNYSHRFYGPSTLRVGLEKSRNLMTVRLAQNVGMDVVVDYAKRMGVVDEMLPYLPMALGAAETTLLRLTSAYSIFVNGGKRIQPTLIDRIQDRRGATIYRHDERPCDGCTPISWQGQPPPELPDTREQALDPATAYQIVSILQGVVERGTGVRIAAVGKPLAGKTGTSNDSKDTWFIGFSPDLAVGVFVGFDEPRSLGAHETGSSAAAPIFKEIMTRALADQPGTPFRIPPGVKLVRVEASTGLPTYSSGRGVIWEAFKPGTEPHGERLVLDGGDASTEDGGGAGGWPAAADALETAAPRPGGLY